MPTWDRRTPAQLTKLREAAVRAQLVDAVAPFSPWWRDRLAELGRTAESAGSLAGLATLPAAGERDVCPDGDPAGAAALVLQAGEDGYALHAPGPRLRQALRQRAMSPAAYATAVEADTRPTSYVWAGLSMRFPVASTRSDLDVVARAGARLWSVLGLSRGDVLVAALPPGAEQQALQLAAVGAASPALFPGEDPAAVAEALRLLPVTVLALRSGSARRLLARLAERLLGEVRTVLLVGAPTDAERASVRELLPRAAVLAVHAPDAHRLLWGQCRESAGRADTGLHTYPDLEVVGVVDPETGDPARRAGELVLTQLGMYGSALVRWRTADLVAELTEQPCPACGRTVPRLVGLERRALVPELSLRQGAAGVELRAVDLRGVASALVGRREVADWRLEVTRSPRTGDHQVVVHVVPRGQVDPRRLAIDVDEDVRVTAGVSPDQVVLTTSAHLPDGRGPARRTVLRG